LSQADKTFDIFESKMINSWNNVEISMSTLVSKIIDENMNLKDEPPFKIDMQTVGSCYAKEYGKKGCTMGVGMYFVMIIHVHTCIHT